jgi:hypothetical protein
MVQLSCEEALTKREGKEKAEDANRRRDQREDRTRARDLSCECQIISHQPER